MMHPIDAHIGRRIREERLLAGLTQQELAASIGVKFQQLQKYETAANRVSGSRLWMICRSLGISVESLMPTVPDPTEPSGEEHLRDALLVRDILGLEPEIKRAVVRFIGAISKAKNQVE